MDIEVNNVNCIKLAEDFGGWTVHNICTGAESFVPWGQLNWVAFMLVAFIFAGTFYGVYEFVKLVRGDY